MRKVRFDPIDRTLTLDGEPMERLNQAQLYILADRINTIANLRVQVPSPAVLDRLFSDAYADLGSIIASDDIEHAWRLAEDIQETLKQIQDLAEEMLGQLIEIEEAQK